MNSSFLRHKTRKLPRQRIMVKNFQSKLAASFSVIVHSHSKQLCCREAETFGSMLQNHSNKCSQSLMQRIRILCLILSHSSIITLRLKSFYTHKQLFTRNGNAALYNAH